MEQSLLQILQDSSIAVVAVAALVFVVHKFLQQLDKQATTHNEVMTETLRAHRVSTQEREDAIRDVEREFRSIVLPQLIQNTESMRQNTESMRDNTTVMERVVNKLESQK